jgi:colicin import membrane protein
MKPKPQDYVRQALSITVATGLNGLLFVSILLMGMTEPQPPPPEIVEIDFLEVARKSDIAPKPRQLVRLTKPPPPPPPETDVIGLKKKKEVEEFEKKKKERAREVAEKRRRDDIKRKKVLEQKRKVEERRRERRKAMNRALQQLKDPRADDEDAPGFKAGHELGRSTDPNSLRNKLLYTNRLSRVLQSQFQVPNTIPPAFRKTAKVRVFFRVSAKGKVLGEPKVIESSGNSFFDRAALTTVKRFGAGSPLRLPLPKDEKLKEYVLRAGIQPRLKGK